MANSEQSDNLITQSGESSPVAHIGREELGLSQNPDTRIKKLSSADKDRTRSAGRVKQQAGTEIPAGRQELPRRAGVIYIKERYFTMLKKDLILRNPLRVMGYENDDILGTGQFGAVLARAGVGKTAFLVQLSLNALLRGKNVLHISLEDPVNKVSLWYKEVFNLIAEQYQVEKIEQLWDSVLPHRFIMTFRVEGFSVPKLEERLSDLMEQNIFSPQMIIIDGFPFGEAAHQPLSELKELVEKHQMHAWFTMRTHRHEDPGPDGRPLQLEQVSDLFETAIQLMPEGKEIHVKPVKGGESFAEDLDLRLDPSTMLLKRHQ